MATTTRRAAKVTLPRDDQILITREFAAPRHLVYRAYTTPELVARWWHADRGIIDSIEIDLRVGGRWRYAMTANAGFPVVFHGEYLEIVPEERLVSTEIFEGMPDAAATSTATFTAALALLTHLLSDIGKTPMPTTSQMSTMTMISAQVRLIPPQKAEASVPANTTNTAGAQ